MSYPPGEGRRRSSGRRWRYRDDRYDDPYDSHESQVRFADDRYMPAKYRDHSDYEDDYLHDQEVSRGGQQRRNKSARRHGEYEGRRHERHHGGKGHGHHHRHPDEDDDCSYDEDNSRHRGRSRDRDGGKGTHHRHHHHRHGRRSRDSRSSTPSRTRSEPTPNGSDRDKPSTMRLAASAALAAGGIEALRVRKEPGSWVGDKGRRVVTAALGAAAVNKLVDKGLEGKPVRQNAGAALGGLIINRMMNGKR